MANGFDEIGLLFLQRRNELGLTQEQLGEKAGVTISEISLIENGRDIAFSAIDKLSDALGLKVEVRLRSTAGVSNDIIHYIVMSLGLFARKYNLSRKEACNYLARFKGLEFSINNYEAEHQLSLQDCVNDMAAICRRNGGAVG